MNKILLIGNPNTGKTTLFNTLTKSNEHVGNWHGVTVGEKSKKFKFSGREFELVDLPGLYSLETYSEEEEIAKQCLERHQSSVVVNICDANHLERNLLLTLELEKMGIRPIVVVNMSNERKNIDYDKLSRELGTVVLPIDARKKKSAQSIMETILKLGENPIMKSGLLQGKNFENIQDAYRLIKDIMKRVVTAENVKLGLSKLDKIVTNRFLFFPIFMLVMGFVFFLTFGPLGTFLSGKIGLMSDIISKKVLTFVNETWGQGVFFGFLSSAIFGGISSVLEFVPQVGLLFLCLGVLEDIGYLPRVAYALDGSLKKIGLTGRSLFSLLMGFGCTTTAMMTTRNLDNDKLKKRTAFVLPFMSCSAKLPIFLVIISSFFSKYKVLSVFVIYLLSILVGIGVSAILAKIDKNKKEDYFLMELPKFRIPSLTKTIKDTMHHVKNFLIRIGTVILLSSIVIWFLLSFSTSFDYLGEDAVSGNSILSAIAGILYPIFKPIGFSSPFVVVALLTGLVGKEMVVSTIGIINQVDMTGLLVAESIMLPASPIHFSVASAVSFVVFTLFYPPCESAIVTIKKEFGWRFMFKSVGFMFAVAYVMSFVAYRLVLGSNVLLFTTILLLLAIFRYFMIKFYNKKNKCEECNVCNRLCGRTKKIEQSGARSRKEVEL